MGWGVRAFCVRVSFRHKLIIQKKRQKKNIMNRIGTKLKNVIMIVRKVLLLHR